MFTLDHTEFHSCHTDTTAMQELAMWPLRFIEVLFFIGETLPEGATDTDPTSRPPLLVNPEVTLLTYLIPYDVLIPY